MRPRHAIRGLRAEPRKARFVEAARFVVAATRLGGVERRWYGMAARAAYGLAPVSLQVAARDAAGRFAPRLVPEGRSLRAVRPDWISRHRARRRDAIRRHGDRMTDIQQRLLADTFETSLPALLRYGDRSSMTFSVESRTPFLDVRVVEAVMAMPADVKIRNGWTKWVLREAMAGELPAEVQWRRDKKGFLAPETAWLEAGADRVRALFQDGATRSGRYLRPEAVVAAIGDRARGTPDAARATDVWRWLVLELWMRRFIPVEDSDRIAKEQGVAA